MKNRNKTIFKILCLVCSMVFIFAACGNDTRKITFTGSSTLQTVVSTAGKLYAEDHEEPVVTVTGGGSGAGIKAVIEGTADLGMVSREVTPDEKSKIENYNETLLGYDALTIAVNPDNKIYKLKKSLSMEEIRKIFSGEYKFWDQVQSSLPHEEIVVVIRDIGGGAHKVFQNVVMGEEEVREDAIQAPSMGALTKKIIENKNAIGYASIGLVNQNKDKLFTLHVDNIQPSYENIINKKYQITRPLLIIKNGDFTDEEKELMEILTSGTGKEIMKDLGFVPKA